MKIVSWNVNGLRAVYKKGFLQWFLKTKADIVCLQEIKSDESQLPQELAHIKGYFSYFHPAEKKGYSGVAVYTKTKPKSVKRILGLKRFDNEGRILELTYPHFTLLALYIPHGGRQKENLEYKLDAYRFLRAYCVKNRNKNIVLIGDFNIAHHDIDLERPKANRNNIMFTPEERSQIDALQDAGFADTFRSLHPDQTGQYTWWPYFANARKRNLGWRIDYVFLSKPLKPKLIKAFILPGVYGSDHCPVGIELHAP